MTLIGKSIGRYRIIEQLGQGGMAVVYKAFDTRLQRDVALKLIRTGTIPPDHLDKLQKRFEREALTQSRFDHPNIVPIFDFGEHEGAPYLVMAYRPGGTLQDLTGQPMPYPQAAALLAPIADAVSYAHEKDVLHRDIKPSNILLGEKGIPALTDFGIAKLLGEVDSATLTGTGMGIGTPQYMAPEQWKGQPEKATDIYALGVVFYELITGRKPYDAETPAALVMILATEPLPAPTDFVPGLPEHVEKVLYKALAPAPDDRYESMAEFAKVLEGLSREKVSAGEAKPALPHTEVMLPIEEQAEEAAEPEPSEPVIPTLYPQETPTEATPLPVEPEIEEVVDIPPLLKPNPTFKMPVWGWGLIGLVVLAGIVFGAMQMDFGGTPMAEVTATETEISAVIEQPTETIVPTNTHVPTKTNTPEPTVTETLVPTPTALGGGGRVVFASDRDGDMDLYILNLDTEQISQLTNSDSAETDPFWSPEADIIVFISDKSGSKQIYSINPDGTNLIQLTSGASKYYPSFSSSENKLAYTFYYDRWTNPYAYEFDRYNVQLLDIGDRLDIAEDNYTINYDMVFTGRPIIKFSPDGTHLLQNITDNYTVLRSTIVKNLTTGDSTDLSYGNLRCNFSYDNRFIACPRTKYIDSLQVSGIYFNEIDQMIESFYELPDNLYPQEICWSPSGDKIIFSATQNDSRNLYMIDIDGENLTQLTDDPSNDFSPFWVP